MGYSIKQLSNHQPTLSPKNLENISDFESSGLTLIAHKEKIVEFNCLKFIEFQVVLGNCKGEN